MTAPIHAWHRTGSGTTLGGVLKFYHREAA